MIAKNTMAFLKGLKKHNDRKWFQENKEQYQFARKNFMDTFDELASDIVTADPNLRDSIGESHIFRLNRDVRFSKNKDPYKFHFGAYICPGGKSNIDIRACYYLHIEPGNNFFGGGVYSASPAYLAKIRETLAKRGDEFLNIVNDINFIKHFGEFSSDNMLKTAPRGYPKDHIYIQLLRCKSFTATYKISDTDVLSGNFLKILEEKTIVLKSLNDWLNSIHI